MIYSNSEQGIYLIAAKRLFDEPTAMMAMIAMITMMASRQLDRIGDA